MSGRLPLSDDHGGAGNGANDPCNNALLKHSSIPEHSSAAAHPLYRSVVVPSPLLKPYLSPSPPSQPPPIFTVVNGDAKKKPSPTLLTEKYYIPAAAAASLSSGPFNGGPSILVSNGGSGKGANFEHQQYQLQTQSPLPQQQQPQLHHHHHEIAFHNGKKLPSKSFSGNDGGGGSVVGHITFWEMLRSSKKCLISFIVCLALIVVLLFAAIAAHIQTAGSKAVCDTAACWQEVRRIEGSVNENVSACDDFYSFVCGKWMANTAIPDHKPQETRFDQLQDKVKQEIKEIIERKIDDKNEPEFVLKMKRFYNSCMNLTAIDSQTDLPIRKVIEELGGWPVLDANWSENLTLVEMHKRLRAIGLLDDMIISITIVPYDKNNSRNILGISQPSFGLLDRDFMVRDLTNDTSLQRYYRLMLYTIKLLSDKPFYEAMKQNSTFDFFDYDEDTIDDDIDLDPKIKIDMLDALIFEQHLANNSLKKEDNRNLTLLFNNMTIADLEAMSPNVDWLQLINVLTQKNLTSSEEIVVFDVNYVKFLSTILTNTSSRIITNYMIWRSTKTKIGALDMVYQTLKEMYNAASLGNAKPEPRWMQCVAQVQLNLGTALSNVYVKNQLTRADKEVINNIVLEIKEEFYQTLKSTEWMETQTRKNAIDKLKAMEFRIGFPDEILIDELINDYYKELVITENGYFENILSIGRFSVDSVFHQLREPNSRDDWRKFSEVVDVNAFYFHQENTFILNAGLLQGIFFNPHRPNYLNYGAIGEVVGHEITHGFDGFGKQFDSEGQLKNWWNHATSQMFEQKASCIVEQYNQYYIPEVEMHLNGVNTQDENIADNGGVSLAYKAYKRAYAAKRLVEPVLPVLNYTTEQLFWISYGIGNCEKMSNEMLRLNIQVDSHSPSRFRLNGVVSNSFAFSNDFHCPVGSPMNPIKKCKVW